jgi:DnaJ family protein A protein 2
VVEEQKILEVHIDKGMRHGQKITFQGEGDQGPNIIPGDVIFVVDEKPHDRFQRKGNDLFTTAKIDLLTALAGGSFGIKHLDGEWLKVDIIPGEVIAPGAIKMIAGKGMPSYRHHDYGNMIVNFEVDFPKPYFATPEQLTALEQVLPPRKKLEIPNPKDEFRNDRHRTSAIHNGIIGNGRIIGSYRCLTPSVSSVSASLETATINSSRLGSNFGPIRSSISD